MEGLPPGAETTSDIPSSLISLVVMAMDRTEAAVEHVISDLKPDFIFFDFAYWIPTLACGIGIIPLLYSVVSPAAKGYNVSPSSHKNLKGRQVSEADLMKPPPGYPDSNIYLYHHEARDHLMMRTMKLGGVILFARLMMSLTRCEAIGVKACREIDGPFVDYLEKEFGKPLLLTGPLIPESPTTPLDQKWVEFLGRLKPGSVIYCGFGSELILTKDQFQKLRLGFENTFRG